MNEKVLLLKMELANKKVKLWRDVAPAPLGFEMEPKYEFSGGDSSEKRYSVCACIWIKNDVLVEQTCFRLTQLNIVTLHYLICSSYRNPSKHAAGKLWRWDFPPFLKILHSWRIADTFIGKCLTDLFQIKDIFDINNLYAKKDWRCSPDIINEQKKLTHICFSAHHACPRPPVGNTSSGENTGHRREGGGATDWRWKLDLKSSPRIRWWKDTGNGYWQWNITRIWILANSPGKHLRELEVPG